MITTDGLRSFRMATTSFGPCTFTGPCTFNTPCGFSDPITFGDDVTFNGTTLFNGNNTFVGNTTLPPALVSTIVSTVVGQSSTYTQLKAGQVLNE